MKLRARILRTVGFNLACVVATLIPFWVAQGMIAPYLLRNGYVTETWDFYTNMR